MNNSDPWSTRQLAEACINLLSRPEGVRHKRPVTAMLEEKRKQKLARRAKRAGYSVDDLSTSTKEK